MGQYNTIRAASPRTAWPLPDALEEQGQGRCHQGPGSARTSL